MIPAPDIQDGSSPRASRRGASRLAPGEVAPILRFRTLAGHDVTLGALDLPVHIQFRRFAGCPVCNLHLQSFVARRGEWEGVFREIVLFPSPEAALAKHAAGLPFDLVADPERRIYRAYRIEAARRSLLDPRAWPAIARAVAAAARGALVDRRPMPPLVPAEGRFGLPADFLIGPGGAILALRYGAHAADHWSVDEVLRLAVRARTASADIAAAD